MSKKIIFFILLSLLLFSLCGCGPQSGSGDSTPASQQTEQPVSTPEATPEDSPEPEPTATPTPQPEITPPAEEPFDPASGTDVIYESEVKPPDPVSDTDLEAN